MRVLHFWAITDPHPTFACGVEPTQGVRNMAPALSINAGSIRWFQKHAAACKNCLRVMRARVPSSSEGGER